MPQQIPETKFHNNLSCWSSCVTCRKTGGRTDRHGKASSCFS